MALLIRNLEKFLCSVLSNLARIAGGFLVSFSFRGSLSKRYSCAKAEQWSN